MNLWGSRARGTSSPDETTAESGQVNRRAFLTTTGAAAALAGAAVVVPSSVAEAAEPAAEGRKDKRPLIVGHRGASGYRPEHTLASYELAARMGADFMEQDLVPTKDGHLVCRHEPEIGGTTDVADHPEFASRKRTKTIDDTPYTGWFTEDFTLAELRTLRANERVPKERPHNTLYNGRFQIPTFEEVLELRTRLSKELGREVGIYPELKHSTYFRSIGLPLEQRFLDIFNRSGLNRHGAPVFVQSFEVGNLRWLRSRLKVRLVQLTDATGGPADLKAAGKPRTWADITSAAGLREVATYADAVGPATTQVVPVTPDGGLGNPTSLVSDAHAAGLLVHPYTFRNENAFLPPKLRRPGGDDDYGDVFALYDAHRKAGVDGFFTDNTDTAIIALR
ncbi:glycerophosphodiester phosphodiesterase [Pseudonocardia phyllosphaerae]|uniref:glycerophosphodiester phosphodiesterase n=1 Tax=Pseudonocardia phyllosphaerae TaxID=3390502 RepID=UPI0039790319